MQQRSYEAFILHIVQRKIANNDFHVNLQLLWCCFKFAIALAATSVSVKVPV